MFLIGFPLLLIPFAIYNIIALLMRDVEWTTPLTTVHMMSGKDWVMTWEDVLVGFAILLLAIEIMKSTRTGTRTIMDHILSMALFVGMLVEFLLLYEAGTSTFFLLMLISLVDVVAGFIISIRTAKRDIDLSGAREVL
jgi:hypothetical protein